jgi:regulator of sigma E protease
MNGLIMAAQLILGLSILITLHELGHFLAARAFKIKVEKFYLFFDAWGFKLFSFRRGSTEYGIGWLPLGGYVKIAGMVDESMDREQLSKPPEPWEFRSKPAWQRLIVMIAGVTMNAILAIVIFWMMTYSYGESYLPASEVKYGIVAREHAKQIGLETGDKVIQINGKPLERFEELMGSKAIFGSTLTVVRNGETLSVKIPDNFIEKLSSGGKEAEPFVEHRYKFIVGDVLPGGNAEKAGLLKSDRIVKLNGDTVLFFDQLQAALRANKGKPVSLTVLRDGEAKSITAQVDETGKIGFVPEPVGFNYKTVRYTFFESLPVGLNKAVGALVINVKSLGKIFRGEVSASNSVQGPIGIAHIYGGEWNWIRFWSMTGLLSMVLAFMNILPIPALDGGHVVFLTIEAITRRKFSDAFMEKAQMVGMMILLALMVFAIGNDVWKYILK